MINTTLTWLSQYQAILTWLGLVSLLMFVFSLLLLPWLIKKIPADYFQRPPSHAPAGMLFAPHNIVRNALGFCILLAGLAMFVLPGQGILTVMVGIAIMQFPGKYQLERWLVSRNGVLSTLNWFRRKTHAPELRL